MGATWWYRVPGVYCRRCGEDRLIGHGFTAAGEPFGYCTETCEDEYDEARGWGPSTMLPPILADED